jgi:hypothetical protein
MGQMSADRASGIGPPAMGTAAARDADWTLGPWWP